MSKPIAATTLLHRALALDARGHESQAIPLYRQAIKNHLFPHNLRTALICLGSSLCATGQIQPAIRILQKGRRLFPNDPTITLFLALAHYDAGQPDLALRQLADTHLNESGNKNLAPYRAILKQKYHALRRR